MMDDSQRFFPSSRTAAMRLAMSLFAIAPLLLYGCAGTPVTDRPPQPEVVAPAPQVAPGSLPATEPATPPEKPVAEPPEPLPEETPVEPAESEIAEPIPVNPEEEIVAVRLPATKPPVAEPNEATPAEMELQKPQEQEEPEGALVCFDHRYGELLQQYVRQDGCVDYGSLRRKRLLLKDLLWIPHQLDPNEYCNWTEDEKLAFWINTYNLKMLDVIARNHPIQSSWWLRLTWPPSDIRHIDGIWSNYKLIVMDEEFTLGEVERRFFDKSLADPRAFLAITYASRSSPRLRRQPYRGEDLDRQLDEQIKTFLTDGGGFRIDHEKAVVHLSALFKPTWRGQEFVARYGTDRKFKDRPAQTRAVLNFLIRYIAPDEVHFLEVENYSIEYTGFDWRLNDTSRGY